MRFTKINGCDDGTCPAIYETDTPDIMGVQGARPRWRDLLRVRRGRRETVVLVPRSLLDEYAASRR